MPRVCDGITCFINNKVVQLKVPASMEAASGSCLAQIKGVGNKRPFRNNFHP